AAHEVQLGPRMRRENLLMLDGEPALVAGRREARAVLRKLAGDVLDGGERRRALLDEPAQDLRRRFALEAAKDAVVVRRVGDVPTLGGAANVRRGAAPGERRVDLHRGGKDLVAKWNARAPALGLGCRLLDALAERLEKQLHL